MQFEQLETRERALAAREQAVRWREQAVTMREEAMAHREALLGDPTNRPLDAARGDVSH